MVKVHRKVKRFEIRSQAAGRRLEATGTVALPFFNRIVPADT